MILDMPRVHREYSLIGLGLEAGCDDAFSLILRADLTPNSLQSHETLCGYSSDDRRIHDQEY